MDISLIELMESQLKLTTSTFHRYMYDQVSWESRMFGLIGPRVFEVGAHHQSQPLHPVCRQPQDGLPAVSRGHHRPLS